MFDYHEATKEISKFKENEEEMRDIKEQNSVESISIRISEASCIYKKQLLDETDVKSRSIVFVTENLICFSNRETIKLFDSETNEEEWKFKLSVKSLDVSQARDLVMVMKKSLTI
jgi:hypothetical protein